MRTLNILGTLVCLLLVLVCESTEARTNKYDRGSSKKSDSALKDSAPAETDKATSATSSPGNAEKKIDISDLENKYWTAKDTEFNVVQNRLYTKAKKFSVTPTTGPLLTDSFNTSWNYGVALNYYFTEREGVEVTGWKTASTPSSTTSYFTNRFAVQPDYNIHSGFIGVSYNWIPVYAKLSLLEKKIFYFDMSLSPGLGVSFMNSNTFATTVSNSAARAQTPITLSLDFAQQVFISEHFALRLDLRNHFYQEKIYKADLQTEVQSKSTYYGSIMLGVTIFQ
ncbi:MAG: outer membrane beta-barrel domain-containing protein [Oligoflexia bacterium]|nr:outer membrane beta-barrel domain-containing protein [Oligoflexia bacterium]